jgi:hypothetical protein
MKRLILIVLASCGLAVAQAQSVIPDALGGALVGTVIGGIAGGNCHNGFSGNGAAIGAGVGLAAGAILGTVKQQTSYPSQPYVYYAAPVAYAQPGYGYAYAPVHQIADAPRVPDAPTF